MKQIAVFLAEGFEEIEGLTVTDLLRRAGVTVTNVSVTGERQYMAHTESVSRQTPCLRRWSLREWICSYCRVGCRGQGI